MTGDEDGDGISAHRTSHRLGGHRLQPPLAGQLTGQCLVCGGAAIGDGQQQPPDLLLEGGARRGQGRGGAGILTLEIGGQPGPGLGKDGQVGLLGVRGQRRGVLLSQKPQPGEGFSVAG